MSPNNGSEWYFKKALPLKERQVVGGIKNKSIKLPNSNIYSKKTCVNHRNVASFKNDIGNYKIKYADAAEAISAVHSVYNTNGRSQIDPRFSNDLIIIQDFQKSTSQETKKGSSLSNTKIVPQTRSEP